MRLFGQKRKLGKDVGKIRKEKECFYGNELIRMILSFCTTVLSEIRVTSISQHLFAQDDWKMRETE